MDNTGIYRVQGEGFGLDINASAGAYLAWGTERQAWGGSFTELEGSSTIFQGSTFFSDAGIWGASFGGTGPLPFPWSFATSRTYYHPIFYGQSQSDN